jgi:hypothetical protein
MFSSNGTRACKWFNYIGCIPVVKLFLSFFTMLLKGMDKGKHSL